MPVRLRVFLLPVILTSTIGASFSSAQIPRSTTPRMPDVGISANVGCCSDPDVKNYGNAVDLSLEPEGYQVTNQYRPLGILFGRGLSPIVPPTIVRIDDARSRGCRLVLNGDPVFSGWELMGFVDRTQAKWAAVQKVGVDMGYCDVPRSCFIAAYDWSGRYLASTFNTTIGFQFLAIERPSADISYVMTGDCVNVGFHCQQDAAGSAINCIHFTTPVTLARTLPDTLQMPDAPPIPVPAARPWALGVIGLLLAGTGAWTLVRKTARASS